MRSLLRFVGASSALCLLAFLGAAPAQDQVDPNAVEDGVEIQTRGPVHEAFAQPSDLKPVPGQIVPKEPPPPIPEEPPPERPEGVNVQFISGYWAWDPEDSKYLWVSGGYRNVPVGRQWVPGSWVRADGGWRWVSGMWAPERQQELRYTPAPPAPLQIEPSLPAPSDDSTWIAGTWVHRDTRFVWRPGYWSPFRVGRVWVGARHIWTPSGYLFSDGYWDYPWEDRGLLFAPVYFHRPFWHTHGWHWRPSYVVSFGLFYDSCFTHHGSFHLYFGNYYGPRYVGYGFNPWFHGQGRYDAAFGYNRWRNGNDRNWHDRQHQLYADRSAGRLPVPPRTFAQQHALLNSKATAHNQVRAVAPLNQSKIVNQNVNLVRLTPAQADTQKALIKRTQEIAVTRSQPISAKVGAVHATAPRSPESTTLKLPPLVHGTESIRSSDAVSTKKDRAAGSSGSDKDRTTTTDPGIRNLSKPAKISPPSGNSLPKVTTPNVIPKEFKPRGESAPNIIKSPEIPRAKTIDTPAPRLPEIKTPSTPKSTSPPLAPRSSTFPSSPAPRMIELPRSFSTPSPRTIDVPRSAPRISPPSAPRSAPPPSPPPRSGGSRGNGKGE